MQIIVICADRAEYVRKEVDIGIVFFYNPCYDMRLLLGSFLEVFVKIKRRQRAKVYSYVSFVGFLCSREWIRDGKCRVWSQYHIFFYPQSFEVFLGIFFPAYDQVGSFQVILEKVFRFRVLGKRSDGSPP